MEEKPKYYWRVTLDYLSCTIVKEYYNKVLIKHDKKLGNLFKTKKEALEKFKQIKKLLNS